MLGQRPPTNARVTLTIKLDSNWNSSQLANSAPPLSVTDCALAPSARILTTQGCLIAEKLKPGGVAQLLHGTK
jgi:hypothetical protein